MANPSPDEITQLLANWAAGDESALNKLMPLVQRELRRLAHHYMRRERPNHTLQTTALINEAYLKLVGQQDAKWQNREQFFAIAAEVMQRILVDHARRRDCAKRGDGARKVPFEEALAMASEKSDVDQLALKEALTRLAERDARQSRIVKLRYFLGLSIEETAEVLGVSPATVKNDWNTAKAWLRRELSR